MTLDRLMGPICALVMGGVVAQWVERNTVCAVFMGAAMLLAIVGIISEVFGVLDSSDDDQDA